MLTNSSCEHFLISKISSSMFPTSYPISFSPPPPPQEALRILLVSFLPILCCFSFPSTPAVFSPQRGSWRGILRSLWCILIASFQLQSWNLLPTYVIPASRSVPSMSQTLHIQWTSMNSTNPAVSESCPNELFTATYLLLCEVSQFIPECGPSLGHV